MASDDKGNGMGVYGNLRPIIYIVIGIAYIGFGGFIIKTRKFGTIEMASGVAMGFGGLLIIYGLFRIYRGYMDIKQGRG
jgi:hypothetical protein